jgi:hypothetical protein
MLKNQPLHLPSAMHESRQDWSMLVEDDEPHPVFSTLLHDKELDDVLQEFIVPTWCDD